MVKTAHDNQKTSKENVLDHIEENRKILKSMRKKAVREDILNND